VIAGSTVSITDTRRRRRDGFDSTRKTYRTFLRSITTGTPRSASSRAHASRSRSCATVYLAT